MRPPVSEFAFVPRAGSPTEPNRLHLLGNESPHSSPKHSPKQTSKSKESLKIEGNGKKSSPLIPEKMDSDQQDSVSRSYDSALQPVDQGRSSGHEKAWKDRKESRTSDRSKKKWYNALFSTYKSRSEEFKRYFRDVPPDERLVVDYSCALQKDILLQGRLYITQNYLCFYANIFGWETCVSIKWKDVLSLTKEKVALVIPNAILVSTYTDKLFFTTFTARDEAYVMLFRVWQNALMGRPLSAQELWRLVHTAYGEELGLTSEDEDYNYIPPGANLEENLSPITVRLSSSSVAEGCSGLTVEKGTSEVGSSTTDSTNKSLGGITSQQELMADDVSVAAIATEALPTDLSDNSSESDIAPNVEAKVATCTSLHKGRLVVNAVLPLRVDQLFQLLFTNSKFLVEFHSLRRTTDFKTSSWQKNPDTDEKMRTVSMVVTLNHVFAPKNSKINETQILQPCSKHGQLYSIDGEVVNSGVPYADSFYVAKHYCLERESENETSFNVYAEIKYKKNMWTFPRSMVEKSTWAGLEEFYEALIKALHAECDETISKGRKGRRRHRAMASKQGLVPVDQVPSSVRGSPFSSRTDGEKRNDVLLFTILAVLVTLFFLNVLLYYKLWILEDWTQSPRSNMWHVDLKVLENSPKTHEEWLKTLRHQEVLYRMEQDKWEQELQLAVQLLRRAEESLNELRGSIKSPYPVDVGNVLEKKEKQDL